MATNFYGTVNIGTKVDVEAGGTYIRTKVEAGGTYNEYGADKVEVNETKETDQGEMPEDLTSDKAKTLLSKFQEAEMLDENFQPVDLSTYGMAVLANEISKKLWKENRWKPFETLWSVNNLASKYDRALGMGKTSGLIDKIRDIIKG